MYVSELGVLLDPVRLRALVIPAEGFAWKTAGRATRVAGSGTLAAGTADAAISSEYSGDELT